jgi:hypothetical protein
MGANISSLDTVSLITSNIDMIKNILIIFLSSGTIITIWYENRIKKLNSIEEKLREDRRKIYFNLLIPFVKLFNKENSRDDSIAYLMSEDYRRTSFEVTLIGSDAVVKAFGDLMQQTFKGPTKQREINKPDETIVLFANLLLQIRKDLERNSTKLGKKDMLRHMITDIDNYDF